MISKIFFDTSVLVGAVVDFGKSSKASQDLMDAVVAGKLRNPLTAWHCCLEFYSVVTRLPEEFRVSPADAWSLLNSEILERFSIGNLPDNEYPRFFSDAALSGSIGGRVYDRHIGAVAMAMGAASIVTENARHFKTGPNLEVLRASELLARIEGRKT